MEMGKHKKPYKRTRNFKERYYHKIDNKD